MVTEQRRILCARPHRAILYRLYRKKVMNITLSLDTPCSASILHNECLNCDENSHGLDILHATTPHEQLQPANNRFTQASR